MPSDFCRFIGVPASLQLVRACLLAICSVLSFALIGAGGKDAPEADMDGYRLIQKSDFTGEVQVVAARTASKITHKRSALSFIVVPKSDRVTVVNEAAKVFCTIPIAAWKPPFATGNLVRGDQFVDLRLKSEHQELFHDLPAVRKVMVTTRSFDKIDPKKLDKTQIESAFLIVTTKLPSDNGFAKIASGLFGLPFLGGYPLQDKYQTLKKDNRVDLQVFSFEKVKIKSSELLVPTGFKKVDSLHDVYAFTRDNARLQDILEVF
ncbi:MAG TPA: hypothetical protein V6C97_26220 [Oculatellaceae cyanobacterium]